MKKFLWRASLILTLKDDLGNAKQWTADSIKQLQYCMYRDCVTVLISSDKEHYNYFIL